MFQSLFILNFLAADSNRDFYQILGLKCDATQREIEKSYQRLSQKYHPDKNKGNQRIAQLFTDINDAYIVLKDPAKRRLFDLYGEGGVSISEVRTKAEADSLNSLSRSESHLQAKSFILKTGKDYKLLFPVNLTDIYEGRTFPFRSFRKQMCHCPITGFNCPKCNGIPTQKEVIEMYLYLEKGTEEHQIYDYPKTGDTDEAVGSSNLKLEIISLPHPIYSRDSKNPADLHATINITLKEALFGFKKVIPFLDGGNVEIKNDGSINQKKEIRIKNKGLPIYLMNEEFGDLIVHFNILLPKNLSIEQKKQLSNILSI